MQPFFELVRVLTRILAPIKKFMMIC